MFESLTVLGSGTLIPREGRSCSGYLIRHSAGPLLLDCGPGVFLRLHQAGADARALRFILLSHLHIDHVSDLAALLNSRWLQARSASPAPRLRVLGPAGFAAWFARRFTGEEDWLSQLDLELGEMGEEPVQLGGLKVEARRTLHTPDSLCYRLSDEAGCSLFYSGDMDFQESLIPFARGAELGLIEASWTESPGGPGHLSAAQAAEFAGRAGLKRLVLTHFYQPVSRRKVRAQARRVFGGRLYLARDLRTLPLGRRSRGPFL